ncbi:hypothetical protein G6O69_36405 [Pseudenhygromyxa sp. WMMC2535]|uniref:hypothetical protein n=1 Tax=Pseudenhygromyxa sp. WMMC2535 TaxID=2712867 RepID=UPI0015553AB1|nr:hypothetical protein [Pseudenhygromyxa sp. WMMC2535]NVB43365.1 hypothetical protein [Pseudenhygromyxa sp. WMMC2535]
MLTKAAYIVLSLASLGLLFFEAPSGALLTSTPERGKVERQQNPNTHTTVRAPMFVFLGGYHGGK